MLAWPWCHPKGLRVPSHLPQPPKSIIWGGPPFPALLCLSLGPGDLLALGTNRSLRPQQRGWGPGTSHAVSLLGTSPEGVKALKNRENSQSHGSKLAPFHPAFPIASPVQPLPLTRAAPPSHPITRCFPPPPRHFPQHSSCSQRCQIPPRPLNMSGKILGAFGQRLGRRIYYSVAASGPNWAVPLQGWQ